MNWVSSRILWGILLITGGIIFLLQNLGFLTVGSLFWAVVIGLGGLGFLSVFIADRRNWWALIPGLILLGVATVIILDYAVPQLAGRLGGVIVLGSIGLAFLLIYLVNPEQWWVVIPMGVMFTLALVAGLEEALTGFDVGGIFFLGLGLTFLLLAILPTRNGQMRWAFIPAGFLLAIGLLIMLALSTWVNYIWPVVLIAVGLFLVLRSLRSQR